MQFSTTTTNNLRRIVNTILAVILMTYMLLPVTVDAAALTSRKLTLGSSAGNTATTWTFEFTPGTTTALNGITFQVCTTASGACSVPGSWSNSGSAFSSLTYNGASQSGWALDNASGYLRIKNNSSTQTTSGPIVTTFNTVTNPNTTNATFYVRILTYTDDDFGGSSLDSGVVAASTSQQISLSGTMDESLVFCTGTSITGTDCSTVSGSSVNFGTFSSTATRSGTSVMAASTNGVSGYSITINGSTLTCTACAGSPTIAALTGTADGSTTGTAQFGTNLRDNATPDVGADKSGSGSGTYATNYGDANEYRFVTGESVATSTGATNANTFTNSYIVNVPGSQAAGSYTATMTYIATATF